MNGVTLAIPMYRSAVFLEHLFDVIRKMNPPPAEIILLDDASPDDSLAMSRRFCESPPRGVPVRIIANDANLGIAAAYNRLAKESGQPWVHILDADDYPVEVDFYARVEARLRPGTDLAITALETSSSRLLAVGNRLLGNLVPGRPPAWLPLLGSFATRSGVIYRHDRLVGQPFDDPAYPGSDVIHLLRLREGRNCTFVKDAHVHYRIHAGASSSNSRTFDRYRGKLRDFNSGTRIAHEMDLGARRIGQHWIRR